MKKSETPDDKKRRKENGELGDILHKIWEKNLLTWNRGCWEGRGITPLVS